MALFSFKKKVRAGLFIDGNGYQCLVVSGNQKHFSVVDYVAQDLQIGTLDEKDSLFNARDKIYTCFQILDSGVLDKETPIYVSLPITDSLLRIVDLPGVSVEEAKHAFRYEFSNYFPFSLKEGIYDIDKIDFPLINNMTEKRFLVVATRLSLIDNIMTAAAERGYIIAGIVPAQISIERALTPLTNTKDSSIIIYAGKYRSVMILSWRGNGIFYRCISIGFDVLKDLENIPVPESDIEGAEVLNNTDEIETRTVDFVKEIRFSMQFALSQIRGFNPNLVYLCGPGASIRMLDMLKETLSLEDILIVNPFDLHEIRSDKDMTSENWDIPLGTVLR